MENEKKRGESSSPSSTVGTIIGIIAVVVILAIAGFAYKWHAKQNTKIAMATEKKMSPQPTSPAMAKTLFKDGTYTAEGDYMTHVGQEHIKVTVTLKKNIITSADVISEASDPMSKHYQASFISGYKPLVVGKDITTVHLGKVAMSSLTPGGFNSALQTIEQKAKS